MPDRECGLWWRLWCALALLLERRYVERRLELMVATFPRHEVAGPVRRDNDQLQRHAWPADLIARVETRPTRVRVAA
jgi:hypothetical protein